MRCRDRRRVRRRCDRRARGAVCAARWRTAGARQDATPKAPRPRARDRAADRRRSTRPRRRPPTRSARSIEPAAHEALLDALAFGLPRRSRSVAIAALAKHPAPPDVVALSRYARPPQPDRARRRARRARAVSRSRRRTRRSSPGSTIRPASVRAAAATAAAKGARARRDRAAVRAARARAKNRRRARSRRWPIPISRAKIGDQLGKVPDPPLALCLGLVLAARRLRARLRRASRSCARSRRSRIRRDRRADRLRRRDAEEPAAAVARRGREVRRSARTGGGK